MRGLWGWFQYNPGSEEIGRCLLSIMAQENLASSPVLLTILSQSLAIILIVY